MKVRRRDASVADDDGDDDGDGSDQSEVERGWW